MVIPFTCVRIRSRLGLDFARDDEAKYRYVLFYNVIFVSTGIADLPTAARRSLPRDPYDYALRAPLRITKQSTVTLCLRADEERPYLFYRM